MGFLYPVVLWGLIALIIPILIHLFRLRKYRLIYFSDIERLIQAKQEIRQRSQLKHLLLLFLRLLTLTALIFAFARPYVSKETLYTTIQGQKHIVILYVDNSLSMSATLGYHSKLAEAKNKALEIIRAFGQAHQYVVLTNQKSPSDFFPLHYSLAQQKIAEIQVVSYQQNFSEIIDNAIDILQYTQSKKGIIFFISDFQRDIFRKTVNYDTLPFYLTFVPIVFPDFSNIWIDTLFIESPYFIPNTEVSMRVRIKNNGPTAHENIPIELQIDEQRKSFLVISARSNEIVETTLNFVSSKSEIIEGKIICNDQVLTFDDTIYFSLMGKEKIVVGVFHTKNQALKSLKAVWADEPIFDYFEKSIDHLQQSDLNRCNLVVLDAPEKINATQIELLQQYVEKGGHLAIIPPQPESLDATNDLLVKLGLGSYGEENQVKLLINNIVKEHYLFLGVFESLPQDADAPVVYKYYNFRSAGIFQRPILNLQNGDPFLIELRKDKGKIYVFTTSFTSQATDFHIHSLFVPVFSQMAFLSRTTHNPVYFINDERPISFVLTNIDKENRYYLTNYNKHFKALLPAKYDGNNIYFFLNRIVTSPGNYRISANNSTIGAIGVNYPRTESSLNFIKEHELDSLLKTIKLPHKQLLTDNISVNEYVASMLQGKQLWKWLVLIALLSLIIEMIILRFWK